MQLTEIRLLQSSYYPAGEEDPQAAESAAGWDTGADPYYDAADPVRTGGYYA